MCRQPHTLSNKPGPRVSLGMPRQEDMVIGQGFGHATSNGDDLQRAFIANLIRRGDDDTRPQFANSIGVCHFGPYNSAEFECRRFAHCRKL
jgi:hypothetical protein